MPWEPYKEAPGFVRKWREQGEKCRQEFLLWFSWKEMGEAR